MSLSTKLPADHLRNKRYHQICEFSLQNSNTDKELLRTPCTSDTRPQDSELDLNWKAPPWGIAYMVAECNVQASTGGKQTAILWSNDAYELQ